MTVHVVEIPHVKGPHNRQKRRSVTGPWLFVNFVDIEIVCNYAACLSTLKEQKATKTKCPL